MSDPTPAADAVPLKKGPSMLVVGLVGLNLALVAAAGAYVFLSGSAQADDGEAEDEEELSEEGEEGEGEEEEGGEHPMGPLVEFESLVVNLTAPTPDHYLKITFQLELAHEEDLEAVEAHMVPYRDRVLGHLSTLSVPNVLGAENVAALREHLLAEAHTVFGRRAVRAVYFTELLVQ